MTKGNYALELFRKDYSCAQSILMAFAKEVGIDEELAFRIGAGLGGGIGRKQHICGAINGGAIILGLKFANFLPTDSHAKERMANLVGSFVHECEQVIGGTQCKELIKINLEDSVQREFANETGIFERVCNNAIVQVAKILEKHLSI
jgi:C_GCAxxG_C_C family probable redox protein